MGGLRTRHIILFGIISVFYTKLFPQYFSSRNDWKKDRREVFVAMGANNFLGELGGLNRIGTDYSYADLEWSLTKMATGLGYRYRMDKRWALRGEFDYLRVSGSDALTKEPFRNNRNLSFKSNIFEASVNLEFSLSFDKHGNRYHLKHTFKRRMKGQGSYYYLSLGAGAFYFNPKGQYGGNWIPLRPLSTEGQGLPGGPKKYSRLQFVIPMAIGARFRIGNDWTVGIEYNFRKTFTDYIDDVSGVYYDRNLLLQYKGPIAVIMADPSKGDIPTATMPNADGSGAQRGDKKQKDAYMALVVKIGKTLHPKKKKKYTKSKF